MMSKHQKGCIYVPTGGGKTICMIADAYKRLQESSLPKTIIVVAPRILLAQQLCSEFLEHIKDVEVLHVHSAETEFKSTTKTDVIDHWHFNSTENQLIFTTYHSLHKIADSSINVDTIYFDEAHNSVQSNFFDAVSYFSRHSTRKYFLLLHQNIPDQQRTTEV